MSNLDATTLRDYTPLDPARIEAAQLHAVIGRRVEYAAAMPSTMLPAHEAIADAMHSTAQAACHGLVVLTEEQTAGRGRRGRGWHAPPGRGLLMSVLLAGDTVAAQLPWLAMLAGLAVQQAVVEALAAELPDAGETGAAQIRLKWPNDLVWCAPGAPTQVRKLGGTLVESVYRTDATGRAAPYAVLGMGINVNQTADELPPVSAPALPPSSLRLVCGHPLDGTALDRTALAIGICRALEATLSQLGAATSAAVATLVEAWQARLALMQQPIQVYPVQGAPFVATAHAVTPRGELVVVDAQGISHTLLADEVSIRPQAGPASTDDGGTVA